MNSPFHTDLRPSPIILDIGKSYLDALGTHVVIDSVITGEDPLYKQGYRFLGNNGLPYSSNGRRFSDKESLNDLVQEAITVGYGSTRPMPKPIENDSSKKERKPCSHTETNCINVIGADFTLYLEAYPDIDLVRLKIPKNHRIKDLEIVIEGFPPFTIDISQFQH